MARGGIDCYDPENLAVLKDQFASLSTLSNIWFPLTLDIDYYDRVPGSPTLWGHMGLTLDDFSGLIKANPSMWRTGNQK